MGVEGGVRQAAFCKPFHSANWNQWYFKKEKNLGIVERSLLFLSFLVSQALNLLFAKS